MRDVARFQRSSGDGLKLPVNAFSSKRHHACLRQSRVNMHDYLHIVIRRISCRVASLINQVPRQKDHATLSHEKSTTCVNIVEEIIS